MTRFNTQIADLVEDLDLCRNIYNCFQLGQSIRHIAKKHGVSDYAVRKLAEYYKEKIAHKASSQLSDET
jgi:hypothetical protein